MTRRRKKGEGHTYLRGQVYWIKFYANGKPVFESSGSKKLEPAQRLLRKRLGEVDDGLFGAGKGGRVRVAELLDDQHLTRKEGDRIPTSASRSSARNCGRTGRVSKSPR